MVSVWLSKTNDLSAYYTNIIKMIKNRILLLDINCTELG